MLCLLCLLLSFGLCACGKTEAEKNSRMPVLTIGGIAYEPYFYMDADGNMSGIDAEIAREACSRLGYRQEFKIVDFTNKDRLLEEGKIDCIWSCFSIEDHKDAYQWAGPYLYSRRVVAVRKDSEIDSLSDLTGKKIAVLANSVSEQIFLEKTIPDIPHVSEVASFGSMGEVFMELRKEYADAIAGHEAALRTYTEQYPGEYRYLNISLQKTGLGVAFEKNRDPKLVQELDTVLKEMTKDGTIGNIIENYGLDIKENVLDEVE